MTTSELATLRQKYPMSEAVRKLNQAYESYAHPQRLPSRDKQPIEGSALECVAPGKDSSLSRLKIVFRIYAVRPADWDGWHIKECQDMLIRARILWDDNWSVLQGEVISEKVHTKSEEKTVIEIETP